MTTFATVLAQRLRHDGAGPLVTFYDTATGERTELSTITWANWVAKACGLLADEHGLEAGQRLRIDLPTHWLTTVFLGAAWRLGAVVSDTADPDVVVCGPQTLSRWAPAAASMPVLACALTPLGVRFADPLPPKVYDVVVEIWSQPDAYAPIVEVTADAPAWEVGAERRTQAQLWEAGAQGLAPGTRLLSVANPASPPGIASLIEPLSASGSVVLVTCAGRPEVDTADLEAIARSERVDRWAEPLPAQGPGLLTGDQPARS